MPISPKPQGLSTVLRGLLRENPLVTTVWGGTPHHAQLVQAAGFPVFGMSGSLASTQLLGLPDIGLLTMTEMVQNVQRICRAVSIPVIVDCDTGFGNAINVRRTVEEVIRAGAAGMFMEDQVSPKRCGFLRGKDVISQEEAVGKYRAACDVRDALDPDFLIIARTDARGAPSGSVGDVISRCQAYIEAGADVFYPEALQSREEIFAVRKAVAHGLMTLPTTYLVPPPSREEMIQMGLCFSWAFLEQVGAVAMYDFLVDYRTRGELARIQQAESIENHPLGGSVRTGYGIYNLTGLPELTRLERRYLPAELLERRQQSTGISSATSGRVE